MSASLRIGIVGLGGVADLHLDAYRDVEGIEVVAGAEIDPARLTGMADRHGFQPFADFREMLRVARLDAACVLVPCAAHHDVTLACAEAGVHVLCEKPMALSVAEAESMAAACESRGVKFFYGASYRFLPALQAARELVSSGTIGRVTLLSETGLNGRGADGYQALSFDHYPAGGAGGSGIGLVDHGVHLIDAFGWIMDAEVETVFGQGIVSGEAPVTEYALMHFGNGAVGHLLYNELSFSTDLPQHGAFTWGAAWDEEGRVLDPGSWLPHPQAMHVYGSSGALRVGYYTNTLHLTGLGGPRQIAVGDRAAPGHFGAQLEAFADCIRRDTSPAVTADDGIRALRTLQAVYDSAAQGKAVTP